MTTEWQRQVDAPGGASYVVRLYRSGTMRRFPSVDNTPSPGGVLLWPLVLAGWFIHWVAFRRSWTVAVVPWHNLPGRRYRERVKGRAAAEARAVALAERIDSGTWTPERAGA